MNESNSECAATTTTSAITTTSCGGADNENLSLEESTSTNAAASLYYEPFTFISTNEMSNFEQNDLELPSEGLQIVGFKKEDEYEAVLVNDDDAASSFGDAASIYEDTVPPKTAIIALGIGGEGSDSFIFRRFDDNTIIRHKVDTLFTIADFDNADDNDDITIQLNSDIGAMEAQDFGSCYGTYDPTNESEIGLEL